MRYTELILSVLVTGIFCSTFSAQLSALNRLDCEARKSLYQRDSITFISQSFYGVSEQKGFSDFEEWKKACKAMWKLEDIEYKCFEKAEKKICYGYWRGPYGEGKVFYSLDEN